MKKRLGMTQTQYAVHAGVSVQYVSKMVREGRIVKHDDGSVDAKATDALRKDTEGPRSRIWAEKEPSSEEAAYGDGAEVVSDDASYSEARRVGQIIKVRREKLALDVERGCLIDAERARKLAFEMFRLERNAWLNWPARVSALAAAEIGVEASAMERVLDKYVREHLAEIAHPEISI